MINEFSTSPLAASAFAGEILGADWLPAKSLLAADWLVRFLEGNFETFFHHGDDFLRSSPFPLTPPAVAVVAAVIAGMVKPGNPAAAR